MARCERGEGFDIEAGHEVSYAVTAPATDAVRGLGEVGTVCDVEQDLSTGRRARYGCG